MVVGTSGLGRSSFINTLCNKAVIPPREYNKNKPLENPEGLEFQTLNVDIDEEHARVSLTIIDTPGFGDNINNSQCFEKIINYIELQYDSILAEETRIKRNPRFQDKRVHALLYFIAPTGHGLRELDIDLMKKLGTRVNVIPMIGRADSFTVSELRDMKAKIMENIDYYRIPIYQFPYDPVEDDEDTIEECEELRRLLPFAVISHDRIDNSIKPPKRLRSYPWGNIDVDDSDMCDTARLAYMLFNSHINDLKIITDDLLYENYRTEKLSRNSQYEA